MGRSRAPVCQNHWRRTCGKSLPQNLGIRASGVGCPHSTPRRMPARNEPVGSGNLEGLKGASNSSLSVPQHCNLVANPVLTVTRKSDQCCPRDRGEMLCRALRQAVCCEGVTLVRIYASSAAVGGPDPLEQWLRVRNCGFGDRFGPLIQRSFPSVAASWAQGFF